MTSLIVGLVLIVGGIAFAAAPLLRRRSRGTHPSDVAGAGDDAALVPRAKPPAAPASAADAGVALALEELEVDRAMGKLSSDDYRALRAGLERKAHDALERSRARATQGDAAPAAPSAPVASSAAPPGEAPRASAATTDPAELLVHALRAPGISCDRCGPRPEPGARFCSSCGSSLGGCPGCGHAIAQPDARFCDRCGTTLAR